MTMPACKVGEPMCGQNLLSPGRNRVEPQRDDSTGSIFNMERLAVHDGPGIRTILFFKGCPLRCLWCSSPESQWKDPEMGYDERNCVRCMMCIDACPRHAISLTKAGTIKTDRQRCDHCGECVQVCSRHARRMIGQDIPLSEVLREIEKDEVFYHRSRGGVTLSGGEPTMQPVFAGAILRACMKRGIHTAMETCGYTRWEILSGLMDWLDLIYVDIKHMRADTHKKWTGVSNQSVLENIKKIDEDPRGVAFIVRVPVIPGMNDTGEDMEETAAFVGTLDRVIRVELLPYHRYGVRSYGILERAYGLPEAMVPNHEHMLRLKAVFESQGITARIGG